MPDSEMENVAVPERLRVALPAGDRVPEREPDHEEDDVIVALPDDDGVDETDALELAVGDTDAVPEGV